MGSINSDLDIINVALVQLGIRPAVNRQEQTRAMQFANARYEGVRDFVVTAGNWNSATKRAALDKLSSTPSWGFDNEYQLPADFVRFVRQEDLSQDFRLEGRKLLSNWDEANIIYIYRITEVAQMDELLKNAIATRLAFEIALAVKADARQVQLLGRMYEDQVSLANLVDADQAPTDVHQGTEWVDSRYAYPASGYRPIEAATS
jgi:hypothetical protein